MSVLPRLQVGSWSQFAGPAVPTGGTYTGPHGTVDEGSVAVSWRASGAVKVSLVGPSTVPVGSGPGGDVQLTVPNGQYAFAVENTSGAPLASFEVSMRAADRIGDVIGAITDTGGQVFNVKAYGAAGDGVTDDTDAIQEAIDRAGLFGGIVFFPAGIYIVSSSLIVDYNAITLQGVGPSFTIGGSSSLALRGTVLRPAASFTSGDYLIVCNSAATSDTQVSGLTVKDMTLYCSNGSDHLSGGVIAYAPEKALVMNVVVENPVHYGIRMENVGSSGDSARIIDCFVDGSTDGQADVSDGGIWNSVYESAVVGCEVIACGTNGTSGTDAGIVANNSTGVVACCVDSAKKDAYLIQTNCSLTGSRTFGNAGYSGVYLQGLNATAIGNQFSDCGSAGSGGAHGAAILCGSGPCVAIGNSVAAGTDTSYGVYDSTGSIVSDNNLSGSFTGAAVSYNAKGSYHNNVGYNPIGYVSAPSVPASGTALANPEPIDFTVYVNGGTVTEVAIDGTSTGATGGAFRLAAGQTITLTYSAAPTWTWFGD